MVLSTAFDVPFPVEAPEITYQFTQSHSASISLTFWQFKFRNLPEINRYRSWIEEDNYLRCKIEGHE